MTLTIQQTNALELLEAHQAEDHKEFDDLKRMKSFIARNNDCYGRSNPRGHITGSAFVMDEKRRLLLTFHAKLERWLQLGGHSDFGELSPKDTALREAREESGLQDLVFHPAFGAKPVDIDIHVIPARDDEPAHNHLDFRFVLLTADPEKIIVSAESRNLQWWALDQMPNLGFDGALERALGKLRRVIKTDGRGI